mgnify:CR=1 FL=1
MISQEETQHIAHLAKLNLSAKEIKSLQESLSSILDYIEKLKQVDISAIQPLSHCLDLENELRQDETEETGEDEAIVAAFPERQGRLNKVKGVFKNGD